GSAGMAMSLADNAVWLARFGPLCNGSVEPMSTRVAFRIALESRNRSVVDSNVKERSRPNGRPREAHGGAASQRVPASGSAVAPRVSSPPYPPDRRDPRPHRVVHLHADRTRSLHRRTADGLDELR